MLRLLTSLKFYFKILLWHKVATLQAVCLMLKGHHFIVNIVSERINNIA